MRNSSRALIATIAGFAALGFAGIALFYWAAFEGFNLNFGTIDLTLRVLIIAAIVAFSVFILASPESVGQATQKRSARLTANALVVSLVVVGIAVVINIIGDNVPTVRADWTAGQDFTLSPQTIKVLENLDKQTQAVAFIQSSDATARQQADDLLREYTSHNPKLTYTIVDPFRQRAQALAFNITRDGVVAFTNGEKRETANTISERDFTSALVRLQQNTVNTVAFLSGHGERDVTSFGPDGYAGAYQSLAQNNYQTVSWSLVTSPTLTVDQVSVLVIAQPQKPITDKEVATIQQYLDGGGHLLAIMDPAMPADAQKPMHDLLTKYGIQPVQGVVLDLQATLSANDPTIIGPDTYPPSEITADLAGKKLRTAFALSMGFKEGTPKPGFKVLPVVQSPSNAPQGWLETDLNSNSQPTFDQGKDLPGPVNLAMLVEPADLTAGSPITASNTVNTRIVAYGDGDFASNNILQQQLPLYNADLFGNTVSWLAGANQLVSIRPKEASQPRTVALTSGEKNLVFVSTVLGLPLLVGLAGVLVWWRRK